MKISVCTADFFTEMTPLPAQYPSAALTQDGDGGVGSDDPSLILSPARVHAFVRVPGAGDEELVVLGQHIHSALTGCRKVVAILVPGDHHWLRLTSGRALKLGWLASLHSDVHWLFDEHREHCKGNPANPSHIC